MVISEREWVSNGWSRRIRDLFVDVGLDVRAVDLIRGNGSEPGHQIYMPTTLISGELLVVPWRTDNDDLLHELAHHLECVSDRPDGVGSRNWGLDEARWSVGEKAESDACDIEIGLRILWRWPWRKRAADLNLPEWWEGGWERGAYTRNAPRLKAKAVRYLDHAIRLTE